MICYSVAVVFLIIASSAEIRAEYYERGIGAVEGQFPYQVIFHSRIPYAQSSGGAILNENYVIGSASALHQYVSRLDKLVVYVGGIKIYDVEQKLEVAEIKMPNEFIISEKQHDIALVRTKTPIQWTNKVMPIELPSSADVAEEELISSGYGLRIVGFLMEK